MSSYVDKITFVHVGMTEDGFDLQFQVSLSVIILYHNCLNFSLLMTDIHFLTINVCLGCCQHFLSIITRKMYHIMA